MRNHLIPTLTLFAVTAALSPAALLEFRTPLAPDVGGATGTGTARVLFDTTLNTLQIETTFSGLSGTTSVAHIHCCVAVAGTGTAGVAVTPGTLPGFPVGVSAGSYTTIPVLNLLADATYTGTPGGATGFINVFGGGTAAGAEAALLAGLNNGTAYLNIHTLPNFPGGEIRGFLQPVPEPATFAFAGIALSGLLLSRRYFSR